MNDNHNPKLIHYDNENYYKLSECPIDKKIGWYGVFSLLLIWIPILSQILLIIFLSKIGNGKKIASYIITYIFALIIPLVLFVGFLSNATIDSLGIYAILIYFVGFIFSVILVGMHVSVAIAGYRLVNDENPRIKMENRFIKKQEYKCYFKESEWNEMDQDTKKILTSRMKMI